ncbi:MAG: hypothetical protein KatS3mg118_2668 [Paracoccaceae bacterium]|nr:MAG: hypothetical protein KatS3mg118_2668 [Paracoccaceae bacterium]
MKISATARPVEVQELEAEVEQIKREQDYASARKQFDRAAELKRELEAKEKELNELLETWKRDRASATAEVRAEHVAQIVSKITGVPVTELTTEEKDKLLKLEERLHERVIGQDEAIRAVADAVRLARAGLREGRGPTATFLFLGPTGVGKTELAKALAEVIFGDEDAMIRIDMSEYGERHSVARLVGAPPGYVGYEEGGQLTEKVRRRPYSVVLLDEIEKAHPDVYNILLQVFDDGRLTDGKGRVVDFTNTIIIATSNLGSDIIQRNLKKRGTKEFDEAQQKAELMEVSARAFPARVHQPDRRDHRLPRAEPVRDPPDRRAAAEPREAHRADPGRGAGVRPERGRSLRRRRLPPRIRRARAAPADPLGAGDGAGARDAVGPHRGWRPGAGALVGRGGQDHLREACPAARRRPRPATARPRARPRRMPETRPEPATRPRGSIRPARPVSARIARRGQGTG